MDFQSLAQLSQPSTEAQMQVLQTILQIITFSTLVLFAISAVIIIWLCIREPRQFRPGSPYIQVMKDENAGIPVSIDLHTGNSGIHSYVSAFSPWYPTWTRRIFSRSR